MLLASSDVSAAGRIYKCKNEQGSLIYQESPCKENSRAVTSWAAQQQAKQPENTADINFSGTLVIKQGTSGHFFLDGAINGKALTFVVDTGATYVSLPSSLATSAQIYCQDKILLQTANGTTSACMTVIPKLKFGPFLIQNATATISPNLAQPLLGISALQQFKMEQENGELRISSRN
jgi:clan AA aspartic protease (TIGR02281 family)